MEFLLQAGLAGIDDGLQRMEVDYETEVRQKCKVDGTAEIGIT
jgi:hypothetical protein